MDKKDLIESEEFAKAIINMANEKGITIVKLNKAMQIAVEIARNTIVSTDSIKSYDFQSAHIVDNPPKLFG